MIKRRGVAKRRSLEFNLVLRRVRKDKAKFIAMLERNTKIEGACVLWTGACRPSGYGLVGFWHDGEATKIDAQRVFLILALGRPIGPHMEAGHLPECHRRNCVSHVREQHWKENLRQRDDAAAGKPQVIAPSCPF